MRPFETEVVSTVELIGTVLTVVSPVSVVVSVMGFHKTVMVPAAVSVVPGDDVVISGDWVVRVMGVVQSSPIKEMQIKQAWRALQVARKSGSADDVVRAEDALFMLRVQRVEAKR
jgi:hypothetical protein